MKNRGFVVCGVVAGLSIAPCAAKTVLNRPNVVFILADDLGYGDLSVYNPAGRIHTPMLDSLSMRSMRFTNAHASASVSTPTRYGLLTGRYPWRSRLKQGVLWTWADPLLTDEETLPEMLRRNGYATGLVGKWHLGIGFATTNGAAVDKGGNGANVDYTKPLTDGPTHHGFDYYYGDDVPNFPPYVFIENDRFTDIPTLPFPQTGMPGVPGIMSDTWRAEELLAIETRKSVSYIREHKDAPFFLMVSLTAPHTPIAPSRQFEGRSAAGRYGDFVQEMDSCIGEVLHALREAGIEEQTLVIFSSDNGSSFQDGGSSEGEKYAGRFGSILAYGHNPSGPFRGMKSDAWEGGHRIPFLIRWPGITDRAAVTDALVCDLDLFALLADVADVSLAKNTACDSRSLKALLLGEKPLRENLVVQSGNGVLSYIEDNWKLIAGSGSGGSLNPFDVSGELPFYDSAKSIWCNVQLYDLATDESERQNLASQNPARVERMMKALAAQIVPTCSTGVWRQVDWITNLNSF